MKGWVTTDESAKVGNGNGLEMDWKWTGNALVALTGVAPFGPDDRADCVQFSHALEKHQTTRLHG